jgi:hypothetical protein
MSGVARYGVILGVSGAAVFGMRNPTALALLFLLLSLQLLLGAFMVWKRLQLPCSTAAMLSGAATMLLFSVWSFGGQHIFERPWPELLAVAVLVANGPVLLWLDSRRHAERWEAWGRAVEGASLRDMLLFRHFRQL